MAGKGWRKNKRGFLVNSEGKTVRQARAEKQQAIKNFELAQKRFEAASKGKDASELEKAKSFKTLAERDMLDKLSPEKTGIGLIVSSAKIKENDFTKAMVVIPLFASGNKGISSKEIKGQILGDYIVHKSGGIGNDWQVTHIKSGIAVIDSARLKSLDKYRDLSSQSMVKQAVKKLMKSDLKLPNSFKSAQKLSSSQAKELAENLRKAL